MTHPVLIPKNCLAITCTWSNESQCSSCHNVIRQHMQIIANFDLPSIWYIVQSEFASVSSLLFLKLISTYFQMQQKPLPWLKTHIWSPMRKTEIRRKTQVLRKTEFLRKNRDSFLPEASQSSKPLLYHVINTGICSA